MEGVLSDKVSMREQDKTKMLITYVFTSCDSEFSLISKFLNRLKSISYVRNS